MLFMKRKKKKSLLLQAILQTRDDMKAKNDKKIALSEGEMKG